MKYGSLIIEKKEYVFLKRILNISGYAEDFKLQESLQRLSDELKDAQIVDEEEMPADVIHLNSHILIASDKGWKKSIQLVSPAEKDLKNDKISILTPLGAALMGYAEDDVIEWELPGGIQKLTIEVVAQEENRKKIEVII